MRKLLASLAMCVLASIAICGGAAAQVVKGRLAEPAEMSPTSLSVSYALDVCTLNVHASIGRDGFSLAELRIELCSKRILVDEACLMKFVEPALGSFGMLAAGVSQEQDEDLYILHMATRIFEKPRSSYFSPPFIRLTFDRTGLKECEELS